jgi:hypothetical protein
MAYRILVFNQRPIGEISEGTLLTAITRSNYETLCAQYGLNPALIGPARDQLRVVLAANRQVPYFVLHYKPADLPPIVVSAWAAVTVIRDHRLADNYDEHLPDRVRNHFSLTEVIYSVELDEAQLTDMGLLLAYEIARWAAERGEGLVLGLDGAWYGLNVHRAFVPIHGGR